MAITLILKNTTASVVVLPKTGVRLPASGQDDYSGQTTTILKIASSNGVRALVLAGTVVVNDGSADLSVLAGLSYLDVLWSTVVRQNIALLAPGYVSGARLTFVSAPSVTVGEAGQRSVVVDSTGNFPLVWIGTLTANITVAGAGGLQTGQSEAADTWYQVLIIGDSSGTNATAALLLPDGVAFSQSGYDVFRRVGWVRNDGSSNFLEFFQSGKGNDRTIQYNENVPNLRVLNNGSATSFTNVDLTSFVPPIGRAEVFLLLTFDNSGGGGGAGNDLRVRPSDSTRTNAPWRLQPGVRTIVSMQIPVVMFTGPAQIIQYQVSQNNNVADIIVGGYRDEI